MWEAAVDDWVGWLQETGKSAATAKVRRNHVRTVAGLSQTTQPDQLTSDAIVAIVDEQQWTFNYRCDVRTSLTDFCEWAMGAGLMVSNPVMELPGDLISTKRLRIRLSADEMTALAEIAARRRRPIPEVAREILVRNLHETPDDEKTKPKTKRKAKHAPFQPVMAEGGVEMLGARAMWP